MPDQPQQKDRKVLVELEHVEIAGALAAVEAVKDSAPEGPPAPLVSAANKLRSALSEPPETVDAIKVSEEGIWFERNKHGRLEEIRNGDEPTDAVCLYPAGRLAEAERIIRECDSPDGFCGEMPDDLRDRIEAFLSTRQENFKGSGLSEEDRERYDNFVEAARMVRGSQGPQSSRVAFDALYAALDSHEASRLANKSEDS